jgi:membrane fusion protein (multidrug efflux system)
MLMTVYLPQGLSKLSNKAALMKLFRVNFLRLIAGACILSIISCKNSKEEAPKGAAGKPKFVSADAYVVAPQSFSNTYTASGSLLPNEEVEIHPEMSGRVTSITFTEGSKVHKGQVLIQLFDADLRAQLQKLQAQKKLQQATEGRQKELVRIGGISKQDYEATQTGISSINADIAVAEAALSKMRVLAPFDGTIGLRNISVGAVISPTTVIATLQQIGQLKMDFNIPDQYRSQLRLGEDVRFSVDGRLDTLTGKISAIEPGADLQSRTIRIRALVPNGKNELIAGSFAHVVVPFETNSSAILIPSQAIIPTTRDKKVAVVRNNKAQLVVVKTAARTSDKVEITQGLQSGDTILITGLMQVKPDMEVKVRKLVQ